MGVNVITLSYQLGGYVKDPGHRWKRVGYLGASVMVYLTYAVIGLGGRGEIKHRLKQLHDAPLHADVRSRLSGPSVIQPLAASGEN